MHNQYTDSRIGLTYLPINNMLSCILVANASQQSRTTDKCNAICFNTSESNLVKAILNRIDTQWLVYFMTVKNKNDFIIRTLLIINAVRGKHNKLSP